MLRRASRRLLNCRSVRPLALVRNVQSTEHDDKVSSTLQRIRDEIAADKKVMQWRTPVGDRPEDWNSKLKLFSSENQTSDFIVAMQTIDLSPSALKAWWEKRKVDTERFMQQFIRERHLILGAELAAAHFILYRGGSAKFVGGKSWMRANEDGEFNLPTKFDPNYKLEALRCDNMVLYYEGLENLRCLQHLKFLSFHNVKTFDDWCLDRVSGSQYPRLEILDISGTNCTANGLSCLYRIATLKLLIVENPKESLEYELTCAMLEQAMPHLKIVGANEVHELSV